MKSLATLLRSSIDYAGVFPPAQLSMTDSVRNYERYRGGPHAWMLGRFAVPASRLTEFGVAFESLAVKEEWRLTCPVSLDLESDLEDLIAFNRTARGARFDTIEVKVDTTLEIEQAIRQLPRDMAIYLEVRLSENLPEQLKAVRAAGARAKMRTGGNTPEAFPSPQKVLQFLELAKHLQLAWKASGGLHHPVRSIRQVTYEAHSPRETMHGFVNLLLAAALLNEGLPANDAAALLAEEDAGAFRFDENEAAWRGHSIKNAALAKAREEFAIAIGGCSFEEPVEDLKALNWI